MSVQAPRDKLVCALNCCRVINNLLHVQVQGEARGVDFQQRGSLCLQRCPAACTHLICGASGSKFQFAPIGHRKVDDKRDCAAGADDFLPVLIYVVIHANPPQLASNLEYIQRFRMHSRMASESAYFFTQLVRACASPPLLAPCNSLCA